MDPLYDAPLRDVFVFTHWEKTKKPFLINVVGVLIWIVGGAIMQASKGAG